MQIATSVKEEMCTKIKVPRNFCSSDLSLDCVHICLYLYIIKRKNMYVYICRERVRACFYST